MSEAQGRSGADPLPLARTQVQDAPAAVADDTEDGSGIRLVPRPDADDPRVKELIRARLFGARVKAVKIGRFTILDRLGEGGMGVVFVAYDDQLNRKIAVKVLRSDWGETDDGVRRTRMLREAQAMARLSHPNIVTVHEVGLHADEVFIAMEFVRGQSLDKWLKAQVRSWREVVDVFLAAGRGLAAAHRAEIVHRDFKPQNVLVGDEGEVKVLDFGLARTNNLVETAKLTPVGSGVEEPGGSFAATLTRTGAVLGTLAYMAPEQHEGDRASPQSDQFSFCVSLMEGLYGAHPFDCSSFGSLVDGVTTGRVLAAPANTAVPVWLRRVLLRGLGVDPRRRHPSMAALLEELGKDPARVRQRRLTIAALVAAVGGGGFAAAALLPPEAPMCRGVDAELVGVWDRTRSEAAHAAMLATRVVHAEDTWERVQTRLDAYAGEWSAMRQEACETHAAGRQSDPLFDLRTACLDGRRDQLHALVDILAAADAGVVDSAVKAAAELPAIARCGDSEALVAVVPPPDEPEDQRAVTAARAMLGRAQAHEDAGQYPQSLAMLGRVFGDGDVMRYRPLLAEALLQRGSLAMITGDAEAAHQDLERSLHVALAADHDVVAARALSRDLFVRGDLQRRASEALADVGLAEALIDRVAREPLIRAEFLNNLGQVQTDAGDLARGLTTIREALELKRRWLPEDHPEIAYTRSNVATMMLAFHRYDDAVREFTDLLADVQRTLGPRHPTAMGIECNLGYALRQQGDPQRAMQHIEHAREVYIANGMKNRPSPEFFPLELASAALALGDHARARASFAAAAEMIAQDGSNTFSVIDLHEGLGDLAQATGDLATACVEHETSLALRREVYGAGHFDVAYGELHFGAMLVRAGAADEALRHLRAAHVVYEASSYESPALAAVLEFEGRAELLRKDFSAATAALVRSLAIREATLAPTSREVASSLCHLAEVQLAEQRREEAVALIRRAIAILAARDVDSSDLAECRSILDRAAAGETITDAEDPVDPR